MTGETVPGTSLVGRTDGAGGATTYNLAYGPIRVGGKTTQ